MTTGDERNELLRDVQTWWCADCRCEHTASVISGLHIHEFRQVEGQSSLECACGAVPDYEGDNGEQRTMATGSDARTI